MFLPTRVTCSFQSQKVALARKMVLNQHVDWINKTDRAPEAMKDILRLDPIVRTLKSRLLTRFRFTTPHQMPVQDKSAVPKLEDISRVLTETDEQRLLCQFTFSGFGSVSCVQGNVFDSNVDAIILPIPPNLQPHRGLSLEALERGGPVLVKSLIKDSDPQTDSRTPLAIGTVIETTLKGKLAIFVVMPFYWQGNTTDAARRLRFVLNRALNSAIKAGAKSVGLPHIGRGMFGFDHGWSFDTIAEEVVECGVLGLDRTEPTGIERVLLIDKDPDAAEALSKAVEKVSERNTATSRVMPADQFWGLKDRRLLVMSESAEFRKLLKADKVKFKKYSGIIRSQRRYQNRFVTPHVWRPGRVLQAPPLLVSASTGEIAGTQLPPNPFYHRNVSHTLFPVRNKTGFHGLKKNRSGKWMAAEMSGWRNIQETTIPRQ